MRITFRLVMLISSMTAFYTGSSLADESSCAVSLPQNVDGYYCKYIREQDLLRNQDTFKLITGKDGIPFALVDLNQVQLLQIIEEEPFTKAHMLSYQGMTAAVVRTLAKYLGEELKVFDATGVDGDIVDEVSFSGLQSDVTGLVASDDGDTEGKGQPDKRFICGFLCQIFNAFLPPPPPPPPPPTNLIDTMNELLKHLGRIPASLQGGLSLITHSGYEELRNFFRAEMESLGIHQLKFPTTPGSEPFQAIDDNMIGDDYFAQQRLAGANPMSLQRVRKEGEEVGGVDWSELHKTLNPAIGDILSKIGKDDTLFVLRYPLCDGLPREFDLTHVGITHRMEDTRSPIVLFVGDRNMNGGLRPIAIQMDHTPESPMFTPADGDNWMLAKLNVQTTDLFYSQFVEHLSKVHFVTEAFCVTIKRHFSDQHPLQQILKYHCREILVPNVFGAPILLNPFVGVARLLFAAGSKGAQQLINKIHPQVTWDVTDFLGNIKARGLENEPEYFPYRDDGKSMLVAIENMVEEYVSAYYSDDASVVGDEELQAFAREMSEEGKIRGFPTTIKTREELTEILTRIIFHVTAQHASVNYELNDYASYVPIMPGKTYSPDFFHKGNKHLGLPNKATSVVQVTLTMALSTLRYDRLFDYGDELKDEKGAAVVKRAFEQLNDVTAELKARNDQRFQNGRLTYPYMLPEWMPNGIQT